jgi:hypothetical protein
MRHFCDMRLFWWMRYFINATNTFYGILEMCDTFMANETHFGKWDTFWTYYFHLPFPDIGETAKKAGKESEEEGFQVSGGLHDVGCVHLLSQGVDTRPHRPWRLPINLGDCEAALVPILEKGDSYYTWSQSYDHKLHCTNFHKFTRTLQATSMPAI